MEHNQIITKIFWRGKFHNINPDKCPKDERQLLGFLYYNNAPRCFVKSDNYWRKVTKNGGLLKVSRTLYLLTLNEWLEIALNDNYIAEI